MFTKVYATFDKLTEILDRNVGNFIMGNDITFADYAYYSTLNDAINKFNLDLEKYSEVKTWYGRVSSDIKA